MKQPLRRVLTAGLIIASLASNAARSAPRDPSRFLEEYGRASRLLEKRFARIKGTCRLTENLEDRKKGDVADEATFAVDHGFEKVTITRRFGSGRGAVEAEFVYCVGNQSAFRLIREPGSTTYAVRGIGSDHRDRGIYEQRFGRFLSAPYGIVGTSLSRLMKAPSFRLTSVEEIVERGRELVRIEYEVGKPPSINRTWLLLDPKIGWCIRSGELALGFTGGRAKIRFDIEYDHDEGGMPMPRLVTFHDPSLKTSTCEFTTLSEGTTPESEFRMTHYGLPDLTAAAPRRSGIAAPMLALGAVGLLVGGLLWWIGGRNRKRRA